MIKQIVSPELPEIEVGMLLCVNRNKTFNYTLLNEIVKIESGKLFTDGEHTLNVSDLNDTFKLVSDVQLVADFQKQKKIVKDTFSDFYKLATDFFVSRKLAIDSIDTRKMSMYGAEIVTKYVTNKPMYDKQTTSTARISNADKGLFNKVKSMSPEKQKQLFDLLAEM